VLLKQIISIIFNKFAVEIAQEKLLQSIAHFALKQ
jgi:hypothetical protein